MSPSICFISFFLNLSRYLHPSQFQFLPVTPFFNSSLIFLKKYCFAIQKFSNFFLYNKINYQMRLVVRLYSSLLDIFSVNFKKMILLIIFNYKFIVSFNRVKFCVITRKFSDQLNCGKNISGSKHSGPVYLCFGMRLNICVNFFRATLTL